jgi:hypothetical protein
MLPLSRHTRRSDSLVDAAEAKACPILKPRGVATWRIELELNCDC